MYIEGLKPILLNGYLIRCKIYLNTLNRFLDNCFLNFKTLKMKNLINISTTLLLFVCVMLFTSCEKPEEAPYIVNEKGEDFMSTTGKSDSVIDENLSEIKNPVLHMSYDNNVSKEEVYTKFDKVVEEYKRKNKDQNKGANTTWS